MNIVTRFFCWIGGGNIAVLRELPTEHNRFFGYGSVIFMTAIFAMLSSAYAFNLLLYEQIGNAIILPALAWGAFIFVLDRFFIVSLSNSGSLFRRILLALPRLILAFFIGIIISKPLEFRIFQREISDELANIKVEESQKNDEEYRELVKKINEDKDSEITNMVGGEDLIPLKSNLEILQNDLVKKEDDVKKQAEKVNCECNGACGTYKTGRGPACRFEEDRYQTLLSEKRGIENNIVSLNSRMESIRSGLTQQISAAIAPKFKAKVDSLEKKKALDKIEFDNNYKPSILNQQVALSRIQDNPNKPSAYWTILFVTALFIFIEMAPMLLKLMSKPGPYETRIAQIEAMYNTDGRLRRSLDMEEYKSNRGLVQKLARSQRTLIGKALESWHKTQVDRIRDDPEYFDTLFNENRNNDQESA